MLLSDSMIFKFCLERVGNQNDCGARISCLHTPTCLFRVCWLPSRSGTRCECRVACHWAEDCRPGGGQPLITKQELLIVIVWNRLIFEEGICMLNVTMIAATIYVTVKPSFSLMTTASLKGSTVSIIPNLNKELYTSVTRCTPIQMYNLYYWPKYFNLLFKVCSLETFSFNSFVFYFWAE